MKIGVKIWPDGPDYACKIAEHADFIEIMAKRGEDLSFLGDIDLPFVVHAEHGKLGINYADPAKAALNMESVSFAIELADRLDSRIIIVHPGFLDGTPGPGAQASLDFMKGLADSRIIIENMLLREEVNGRILEYPFSTPEKMAELMSATNKGMCLDLSHANVAASFLGLNYIELLGKFMELKPRHFHACGGVEGRAEDLHLHLWEGNLNIGAFKRMLPKVAWVTLETPCELEGQLRDIEIMRS